MSHAPVYTTGEPESPEAARELAGLDALTLRAPLLIGADLADRVIKRYGRLPANCEVYVTLGRGTKDMMPLLADIIDDLRSLPAKACDEPTDDPLPAVRAQRIKPLRGSTAAQWKRERNGRGRK